MNNLIITSIATAALLLPDAAFAHGGQYRGPGDVVPPNAGGGPPRDVGVRGGRSFS